MIHWEMVPVDRMSLCDVNTIRVQTNNNNNNNNNSNDNNNNNNSISTHMRISMIHWEIAPVDRLSLRDVNPIGVQTKKKNNNNISAHMRISMNKQCCAMIEKGSLVSNKLIRIAVCGSIKLPQMLPTGWPTS